MPFSDQNDLSYAHRFVHHSHLYGLNKEFSPSTLGEKMSMISDQRKRQLYKKKLTTEVHEQFDSV